jgi:hypothetical protein
VPAVLAAKNSTRLTGQAPLARMIAAFTETATIASDASKTHARAAFDIDIACGAIKTGRICNKVFMVTSRGRYQPICCWREDRHSRIRIPEDTTLHFIAAE